MMKNILTIILYICMVCSPAFARKVEGRVHYSSRMIAGVIVTDGESFTRTSGEGLFQLEARNDAKYIYLISPYGFTVERTTAFPKFWQEAEGRTWFDFEITPTTPAEDFTLLALPTPEITDTEQLEDYERLVLPDLVNQTTSARIKGLTAGVILGNRVASQYQAKFKKLLEKLKIPVYGWPGEGPDNQAFFIGKDLVICAGGEDAQDFVRKLLAITAEYQNVFIASSASIDNLPQDRNITFIKELPEAPDGYKLYKRKGGKLEWHYHSIEKGDDYQVEVTLPGQSQKHPNEVIAKIWDYDDQWKVSWSQDGIAMGPMKSSEPAILTACPGRYAKTVSIAVESRFGKKWNFDLDLQGITDIQARLPYRDVTAEAFRSNVLDAVRQGVNSLEFNLQLSSSGKVLICRDSYPKFTSEPGGIEAGSLIDLVEQFTAATGLSPMRYTFAINSGSGPGEGKIWPEYKAFADACLKVLLSKDLGDRLLIESYDDRVLNYIHKAWPALELCYLVDTECGSYNDYMSLLDFRPRWIAFQYEMIDTWLVKRAHEAGMMVATWDVNDDSSISQLVKLGVDSIIK